MESSWLDAPTASYIRRLDPDPGAGRRGVGATGDYHVSSPRRLRGTPPGDGQSAIGWSGQLLSPGSLEPQHGPVRTSAQLLNQRRSSAELGGHRLRHDGFASPGYEAYARPCEGPLCG